MPLPRANISGLGAHVSSMASNTRSFLFGRDDTGARKSQVNGLGKEDDDDETSSSGDSDSDMSDGAGTQKFLSRINAATAAKKAAVTKLAASPAVKKALVKNGVSTPQDTPSKPAKGTAKANGAKAATTDSPAAKNAKLPSPESQKSVAKAQAEEDSTSSDSSSDEEDDSDAKKKATPGGAKIKPEPKSDDEEEESSSSEESDDSDSDEEEEAGAKLKKPNGVKQEEKAESSSESESEESDSDSDSDEEEGAKAAESSTAKPKSGAKAAPAPVKPTASTSSTKTKKAASTAKPLSKETVSSSSDSSDEEEEEAPKPKATAAAKGKGKAKEEPESESEVESSSDDEDAEPEQTKAKPVNGKKAASESDSSSDEDSDEEMADESFALVQSGNNSGSQMVDEFVRDGFQLCKASQDADAAQVADMLKKAKKEGKQIWYFTTPASVPISVVETMEFPMSKAQSGKPILSHDGVDFGVDLEAGGTPSAFKILVPAKGSDQYRILGTPVDHTMHLKRVTTLSAKSFTASPSAVGTLPKPSRPQPPVLKARYTPIGVPTPKRILPPFRTISNDQDVSMDDASDSDAEPASKKSKKRKADDDSSKKSKKAKTSVKTTVSAPSPGPTKNTRIAPPTVASLGLPSGSQPRKQLSPVPVPVPVVKTTPIFSSIAEPAVPFSSPTPAASASKAAPKKKAKTPTGGAKIDPKRSATPITQTPIPLPNIPGMKG